MKRLTLVLNFSVLFLNACSIATGMKKMEKNTKEMNQTTQEMSATTQDMNQTTGRMEQKTSEMSQDTQRVREATQEMLAETRQMNETTGDMRASTAEVAKVTAEMAATTANMAATTEELKKTSNDLHAATINLYDDNRQGAALALRNSAREHMRVTNEQLALIGHAAHYFMAFEFQLWKNVGSDDNNKLLLMQRDAVEEFIRTVTEFVPSDRSISPLQTAQSRRSLYAFCAALHIVNSNGILRFAETSDASGREMEAQPRAKVGSMLGLLQDGLAARVQVESGELHPEDLKPHQRAVLEHEGLVVYLLQVRSNFMAAMIAQKLATRDGESLSSLSRMRDLLFPWTAKTLERNVVELGKFLDILEGAQSTREFLVRHGKSAPLDAKLHRFLRKMRFPKADVRSVSSLRADTVRRLEAVVARLLD